MIQVLLTIGAIFFLCVVVYSYQKYRQLEDPIPCKVILYSKKVIDDKIQDPVIKYKKKKKSIYS